MVQTPASVFLEYAALVGVELEAALQRYTDLDEECPSRLRDAMRHSLLAPGKRLRPLLVLMAAETCGCTLRRAMPAAVAVEMVHAYSLIHDDLPAMDDDDLRRGRPTCHTVYGEGLAILAGDALLARAFEVLATGVDPPRTAAACCAELARAAGASALVGGQVDDLAAEFSPVDLAQLERIHRRKTGALLQASLRLGALVAGADDGMLACLDEYGRNVGLAFQIVDDLLDAHGDEENTGKRTRKDQARGKLTFPAALGAEASHARAQQLVAAACGALKDLGPRARLLDGLAHYVLERDH